MKKKVIIIGAGPAGLSLACSLSGTNLQITLIERQTIESLSSPFYDGREIALTHSSKKILENLNVWKSIPAKTISPIKEAKVLDGNSSYIMHFDTSEVKKNVLGYLVSNHHIKKALYKITKTKKNITIIPNTDVTHIKQRNESIQIRCSDNKKIEASLAIAADSRFSEIRHKMNIAASINNFKQTAIVCQMSHELNHENIAYECFFYGETLAVLPLINNTSSIVLTCSKEKSDTLMNLEKKDFSNFITSKFGNFLGSMKLVNQRFSYPLIGVYADRFVTNRFALIGDAAVGMHPVTAHGFNLGLRGQDILSERIKFALKHKLDFGALSILKRYESQHRSISRPLYLGTNAIIKLYTRESILSKIARKAILRIGNNFIPVKKRIINSLTEIQ